MSTCKLIPIPRDAQNLSPLTCPKKMVKGWFWGGFVGVLLVRIFVDVQCVFLAVDVLCVGGSGFFWGLTFLGQMVLR